jgi:hypothetical protein
LARAVAASPLRHADRLGNRHRLGIASGFEQQVGLVERTQCSRRGLEGDPLLPRDPSQHALYRRLPGRPIDDRGDVAHHALDVAGRLAPPHHALGQAGQDRAFEILAARVQRERRGRAGSSGAASTLSAARRASGT